MQRKLSFSWKYYAFMFEENMWIYWSLCTLHSYTHYSKAGVNDVKFYIRIFFYGIDFLMDIYTLC